MAELTASEPTIDEAIAWLPKAESLGYYGGEAPRLLKAASEALKRVLGDDEPRTCKFLLESLPKLHARLLNKATGLSRESARTYMGRAERLLKDYSAWVADPVGFMPVSRRSEASEVRQPKRSKKSEKEVIKEAPAAQATGEATDESAAPGNLVHSLSLRKGRKARIDVPDEISVEELQMMAFVLASHCPDARFEWPFARPRASAETGLAKQD